MLAHLVELNAAVQMAGLEHLPPKPAPEERYLRWGHGDHAWLIWSEHHTRAGEPYLLAAFGSWRSGDKHHWCSLGERLSPDQRVQVNEDWARLDAEAQARQAERQRLAQVAAAHRFAAADPNGYSPYLEHKTGVGRVVFDLRAEPDGTLLIPVLDWQADGTLAGQSLQAIAPDGNKRFQPGGKVRGGFYVIGWPLINGNPFAVCEGVATGISIYQATRLPVVCAFSAGNLAPVVAGLRAHYPDNPMVVCADNDRWTPGNPGLTAARALIDPYRVTVRYPEFGDDTETLARKPTDFNDLARRDDLGGVSAVYQQILGEPVYEAPVDDASAAATDLAVDPIEHVARATMLAPGARKRPAQSQVARQLADALRSQLAWDDPQQAWREYQAGYWKAIPRSTVNRLVQRAMDDAFTDGYSDSYVAGAIHLMANYLAVDEWNSQAQTALPMTNGVLDLTSRTLRPHTPTDGWTWQLPFAYSPLAQPGPVVEWLLVACSGHADRVEILRAWVQAVVLGRVDIQRYLELIGPGGSGKSTFLGLLEALIGAANVQATELKHLEGRFETAGLLGKRLLLVTDQQQYQGEVSTLKSIVGQDPVRIEHKYKGEITSQRIGALVTLAANQAIRASDYSSGMERRRIFIPFDQLVDPIDRRALRSEFEPYLAGVLNWALALPAERVTALLHDPIRYAPSLAAVSAEHQAAVNPLLQWAREELTVDPDGFAPWGLAQKNRSRDGDCEFLRSDQFLYANYSEFCSTHGLSRLSSMRFQSGVIDLLRAQLRLDVAAIRATSGEHRFRHGLRGVRLAGPGDPPLVSEVVPVAPVVPDQKSKPAHATAGFVKKCASVPVVPGEKTFKQSAPASATFAVSAASSPPSPCQNPEVKLTSTTGTLAQKDKYQEVKCASSVFGTGTTGTTNTAAGTTAAEAVRPVCARCARFDGRQCSYYQDVIDHPDVGYCRHWEAANAPSQNGPLSRWYDLAVALAEQIAIPVDRLLAGRLAEPEWDRLWGAAAVLHERYADRTDELTAMYAAIDAAWLDDNKERFC